MCGVLIQLVHRENCYPRVPDDKSPTAVFLCMFIRELIENLVFERNLQDTEKHCTPYDLTTNEEMKLFNGKNIILSKTKKPYHKDYCIHIDDNCVQSE